MLADGWDCLSDLAALRDQPEWWAEQLVKLPPDEEVPDDGARAGSELLWAVLGYRLYGPGPHRQPTLAYRLLMVLLGGGHGRVVLRPGQLLGQDFSLVMAGATWAVAPVFQLARRRIQQGGCPAVRRS
jgi:hypothetical protein